MDASNSSIEDLNPDWNKIARDMTKVGLKNGISDGRDSNFQQSFDKGYEDGFHNGFLFGELKFESELRNKSDTLKHLENAKNGMCLVCTEEKENENVADVREKQTKLVSLHVEKMKQDLEILPT